MVNPSKVPIFEGTDYDYWKIRMRAYLQSLGSEVWEICEDPTYVILPQRVTPVEKERHEANCKALNALISALARPEFEHVCDCRIARELWNRLQNFHEGNNQVKSRLIETHQREYENF